MKEQSFNEMRAELNRYGHVFIPKCVIRYFVDKCQKTGQAINGGAFKFNGSEFIGQYFYI